MNFGRTGAWRRNSAGPAGKATTGSGCRGPAWSKNYSRETEFLFAVAPHPLGYCASHGAHAAAFGAGSGGPRLVQRAGMETGAADWRYGSSLRLAASAVARDQP